MMHETDDRLWEIIDPGPVRPLALGGLLCRRFREKQKKDALWRSAVTFSNRCISPKLLANCKIMEIMNIWEFTFGVDFKKHS